MNQNNKLQNSAKDVLHEILFDHINEGVAVYEAVDGGKNFVFKDFNKKAEEIDHIKKKDIIGKKVTTVFPGIKKLGLLEVFKKVYKTGKAQKHPISFYEDKKRTGWRENHVLKLSTGEVVAIYSDKTDKKKDQEELQESQILFEEFFESSVIGMVVTNLKGDLLRANPAFAEMLGFTIEEVLEKNIRDIASKEEITNDLRQIKNLITGKIKSFTEEKKYIRKDGSFVWGIVNIGLIRNSYGVPQFLSAQVQNITQRKEKDIERDLFVKSFETSPNSMVIAEYKNEKAKIIYVNEFFSKLYGYDKKEVIGKSPSVLKSGQQNEDTYKKLWADILNPKKGFWQGEIINKRKDGSLVSVILGINTIFDKDNKATYFAASHADISKIKNYELELKNKEERLGLALEGSQNGLWDWNVETNKVYFSPRWKEILGYKDDELKNSFSTWEKLLHPKDLKKASNYVQDFVKGKVKGEFEHQFRMIHKDGHAVPILARATTVATKNKKIVRIVGTHTDMSESKDFEKKLQEQVEELEKFNKLMVGRELKMIELKNKVLELQESKKKK